MEGFGVPTESLGARRMKGLETPSELQSNAERYSATALEPDADFSISFGERWQSQRTSGCGTPSRCRLYCVPGVGFGRRPFTFQGQRRGAFYSAEMSPRNAASACGS